MPTPSLPQVKPAIVMVSFYLTGPTIARGARYGKAPTMARLASLGGAPEGVQRRALVMLVQWFTVGATLGRWPGAP